MNISYSQIDEDKKPLWRRNHKGNLIRGSPTGYRITVFQYPPGSRLWRWCISNGICTRYSQISYYTEQGACRAAEEETGLQNTPRG